MGGILYHSGYFMGNDLYPSRVSNPRGFFENDVINGINERILSGYDYFKVRQTAGHVDYQCSPYNPQYGQRWLSHIEPDIPIECDDDSVISEIQHALAVPVFAYKDPRFNYTLPIWNRFLEKDTIKICMFRHPGTTAESVIKDCNTADYLANFYIDRNIIFKLWYNSYQRVLNYLEITKDENIIFVHYEQLLSREILTYLSDKLEINLDPGFISPDLNRSQPIGIVPRYVLNLYKKLCTLSGYSQ